MAITLLRACAKNAVLRVYEKFSTFLRLEVEILRDKFSNLRLKNVEVLPAGQ